MSRMPLVVLAALWAILVALALCCHGCFADPPAVRKPPTMQPWPAGSYPIELRLSTALDDCQRASVVAASAWWEARVGMSLFDVRIVGPDDPAALGIPVRRVIGVVPADALSTPQTVGEAEAWIRSGDLVSVTVRLVGCSPRVASHEIGHALRAEHGTTSDADSLRGRVRRVRLIEDDEQ